ncbi:uncharacterized protein LOC127876164 isoform X1 [Dreissena polymorpha]|uniref:Caspase family p20 domain-containing protein n=1 Tax=Dreissena polymorpha TaxID=45954 RepID=A0A9D4KL35_DREPO|nr:uncharacterized protein LOC127876164 isoform X1 [Dreissena polymorpha]XP_052277124.1 uncharacterized protein LOC127876164 isoform X1 [Dreissena polymorpha]KAH3841494.1 hypothetical protein DPMN_114959 [Dreissena polymorpha]
MTFGTAIIIVNEDCRDEPKRTGAKKDDENMKTMFTDLGFDVKPHVNKTASEIRTVFKEASSIQSDIIVFVISTHGEESHLENINSDGTKVYDQMIFGCNGETVSVNELLSLLDNDALRGRTKLCFIQACRSIRKGKKAQQVDLGVTVRVADAKVDDKANDMVRDKADDMESDSEDETDIGEGDTGVMPKLPETEIEPDKSASDSKSDIAPEKCDSEIAIAPVQCPRDCLVMYGVQPHKLALRSATKGSWMLHYMYEERNILNQNDGNVLKYLTTVLSKMAHHNSKYGGKKVQTMYGGQKSAVHVWWSESKTLRHNLSSIDSRGFHEENVITVLIVRYNMYDGVVAQQFR